MILGIDPKVDYAFKRLFGMERNSDLLIDLLNAVLGLPPDAQVAQVEILNPFNPQETESDKLSVVDIKARDQAGRYFNVEMQMTVAPNLRRRLLYYWTRIYQEQLGPGEDYHRLRPTYSICFLNDVLFPSVNRCHLVFKLLEQQAGIEFTSDLALHTIELPKFHLTAAELVEPLDRWLYFLKHAPKLETTAVPAQLAAPPIQRAVEELTMVTQSEHEHARYETQRKAQMDAIWIASEMRRAKEEAAEMAQRATSLEAQVKAAEGRWRSTDDQLQDAKQRLVAAQAQLEVAELSGKIKALRDLLGLEQPSDSAITAANTDDLSRYLTELQLRARSN